MATTHVSLPMIENAIQDVCSALNEKGRQMPSWTSMTEDDLWRELVACILGSRVRFEVAHSAVHRIEKMRLLSHDRRSSGFVNDKGFSHGFGKDVSHVFGKWNSHGFGK